MKKLINLWKYNEITFIIIDIGLFKETGAKRRL